MRRVTQPLLPAGPAHARSKPRYPISWRSVTLGLGSAILICALTPYNDYALNNTFLIGNNLPLGVILLIVGFVLLVNAPLHRWAPRWALGAGELSVALSMALVSCTLPSSGLMRYFPASLVMQFWHARANGEFAALLQTMDVPHWIYPNFRGRTLAEWMNDPVMLGYHTRWTGYGPPPYAAWLRPALTWGIFTFSLYGALMCLLAIVRRQWVENERLAFPLGQIYLALIEEPAPGRGLNATLARRSFWVAFTCIFLLHIWNGCHLYWPTYVPEIPMYYDLTKLLTEEPWSWLDWKVKDNAVFFTVVGVTYFLPGAISFSLWFFVIIYQLIHITLGKATGSPILWGQGDEHIGGILAFAAALFWIGRHHWLLVVSQAVRGERKGEPSGRYLSYPIAFWGLVACAAAMTAWLCLAGCTFLGAAAAVVVLLMLFVVITRIVAEAGMVHSQLSLPLYRPWQVLAHAGLGHAVPVQTFYVESIVQATHYDFREVMPVYASHGMRVMDSTAFGGRSSDTYLRGERRLGRRFIGLLMLTLLVGYVVSFASTLWTEYRYESAQDQEHRTPINYWGAWEIQREHILNPTLQYQKGTYNYLHSPTKHVAIGFTVTALLALGRWRFAWWPFHPIGFLMMNTFPGQHLWFSIMIGWAAKTLMVRFAGVRGYVRGKPFFLGLIVGESVAAGFWLVMGIVLSRMGARYFPVHIMPG